MEIEFTEDSEVLARDDNSVRNIGLPIQDLLYELTPFDVVINYDPVTGNGWITDLKKAYNFIHKNNSWVWSKINLPVEAL